MKVDVHEELRGFRYTLELEQDESAQADDRRENPAAVGLTLSRNSWRVELPDAFTAVHPDLHAAAILYVLLPFIGSRLELPFGVSHVFAQAIHGRWGVELTRIDDRLSPRTPPSRFRPCLLFSGGADSLALSVVMPPEAVHLFLDRIPHHRSGPSDPDARVDLFEQRRVCDLVRDAGRDVLVVRDDHENLWQPYPNWHSEMSALPALYMADSLGLQVLDSGGVMCAICFGGYHDGTCSDWRFKRLDWATELMEGWRRGDPIPAQLPISGALPMAAGLLRLGSGVGLSQVATSTILNRSAFRGRAYSCYYRSNDNYCMRCDKCFMKLLLSYAIDGIEVPSDLFESFFKQPRLAAIFSRPVFDWHHIWVYLFQKMRCDHPFARAMRAQVERGPDLSVLEKWYPGAAPLIPAQYREQCKAEILRYVPAMSDDDVALLERLDVPPIPRELLVRQLPASANPMDVRADRTLDATQDAAFLAGRRVPDKVEVPTTGGPVIVDSPLSVRLHALLLRAFGRHGARLGNPVLDSVWQEQGSDIGLTLCVRLQLEREPLDLRLSRLQPGRPSLFAGRRLMLWHTSQTPTRTVKRAQVARFVLTVAEHLPDDMLAEAFAFDARGTSPAPRA